VSKSSVRDGSDMAAYYERKQKEKDDKYVDRVTYVCFILLLLLFIYFLQIRIQRSSFEVSLLLTSVAYLLHIQ
jgi:hypothetical protein